MNNKYVKIRSYLLNACCKYFIKLSQRPAEAADEVTLIINNLCKYSLESITENTQKPTGCQTGTAGKGSFYAQDFAAAVLVAAARPGGGGGTGVEGGAPY